MNFKKHLPYIVALVVFAVATVIQFKPLFSGKVINQYDILQYKGMSKEISDFRKAENKEPLWTNSMFGGMPAYQVSALYPGNWMGFLDKLFHLFMPHPGGYMFMFFLGFFILLLCLEINPWVAIVGSLAFGFSSYFYIILEVGHNSKANAMSYIAPVFGGTILLMRKKYWLGFAITTLFMALELNANHPQVAYYGMMLYSLVLISYFIKSIREKEIRSFAFGLAIFITSFIVGVLPNSGSLLCTYEYGKYTTRGKTEITIDPSGNSNKDVVTSGLDKDYAVQYSYGVSESFSFLIPDFKGGGSGDRIAANKNALKNVNPEVRDMVGQFGAYYGPQDYSAGPSYVGAIVMLLACLSLFIVRHTIKWALLIATFFSIVLAWGKYFMPLSSLFLDYFPGYNKFRAVSIINVIAELTIPLLAAMAFDRFIKDNKVNKTFVIFNKSFDLRKSIISSGILVGGFCVVCVLMPDTINTFTKPNEEMQIANSFKSAGYPDKTVEQILPEFMTGLISARTSIFTSDAFRSLIFILLVAGIMILYNLKKIKSEIVIIMLGFFVLADMWPVAQRYLNDKSFIPKAQFETQQMTAADELILRDKALDYRVLNIAASPFQDATTSYYHKSIGGYHGAKLKKYDELIQFHLSKEIYRINDKLPQVYGDDSLRNQLFSELSVLNMLNTKYIIYPAKDEAIVIRNTKANGNAWFVSSLKIVANADSEILSLSNLDTKHSAVIQEKNKNGIYLSSNYTGVGKIKLISYEPNNLVYETESEDKQFSVFSEIYYPRGWKASIDGVSNSYYCVNYLLRGIEIPKGKHRIEFKFEPLIYKTGNTLAYFGSVLVLLSVASGLYFGIKKNEMQNE